MLSAAQRTLGITELLEKILTNLPMEKLFVIQRTNKKFRDTITGSLPLRIIMHLELQPPVYEESDVELAWGSGNRILRYETWGPSGDLEGFWKPWMLQSPALERALYSMDRWVTSFTVDLDDKQVIVRLHSHSDGHEHKPFPAGSTIPSWTSMVIGFAGYQITAQSSLLSWKNHNFIAENDTATFGDMLQGFSKHVYGPNNHHKRRKVCKAAGCGKKFK